MPYIGKEGGQKEKESQRTALARGKKDRAGAPCVEKNSRLWEKAMRRENRGKITPGQGAGGPGGQAAMEWLNELLKVKKEGAIIDACVTGNRKSRQKHTTEMVGSEEILERGFPEKGKGVNGKQTSLSPGVKGSLTMGRKDRKKWALVDQNVT